VQSESSATTAERDVFVELFCTGDGSFEQLKTKVESLTPLRYVKTRLLSSNLLFGRNASWAIFWLNELDKMQVASSVTQALQFVDAQRLHHMVARGPDRPLEVFSVASYLIPMLRRVRGSPEYWSDVCRNLLRMISQFGSPSFFVTLSVNDADVILVEFLREVARQAGDASGTAASGAKLALAYPVHAARWVYRKFKRVLRFIEDSKIFGAVQDYFLRIEFQSRGTAHAHILLWIRPEDLPKILRQGSHRAVSFNDFTADHLSEFVSWYDSKICARVPGVGERVCGVEITEDIVSVIRERQKHNPERCKRSKDDPKLCKHGVPRPMSFSTRIVRGQRERSQLGLRKWAWIADKRVTEEDRYINNFNPALLKAHPCGSGRLGCPLFSHFLCNIDVQVITSSTAAAYYTAKYVSKQEEGGLFDTIEAVLSQQRSVDERTSDSNLLRRVLFTCAHRLTTRRSQSMQEVMWRLLSFPLRQTSRSTVYVNVDPPSKRRINVPRSTLQDQTALEQLLHRSAEGNVTHKSHHLYANRPAQQECQTLFSFLRGDDSTQIRMLASKSVLHTASGILRVFAGHSGCSASSLQEWNAFEVQHQSGTTDGG
jgi:hypothetical protein